MYTTPTQGDNRPSVTSGDPFAEPYSVPLLRLRGHVRQVIEPQDCRVPGCLVCQWRKAGLLDAPAVTIVREPASDYACPTKWCPGCSALRCVCPPEDFEEVVYEHDYALGHDHGLADGPDNRPTLDWLDNAGLYPEAYLDGYDDACAGLPVGMPAEPLPARTPVLWDECDDGLPW